MVTRWSHFFLALVVMLSTTAVTQAASLRPSILAGFMSQPSSQYYNYVYGGQVDFARAKESVLIRLQYIERPEFRSGGYVDQDFSSMFFVGKSLLQRGSLGVTALVGGGYAWGYLKSTQTESYVRNGYRLPGIGSALEGRWASKNWDIRLTHQVLICQGYKDQLQAYVAWPFNWFLISISHPLTISG